MDSLQRRRGKRARDQAQEAAGGARINAEAWYPQLKWLQELGYKQYEIAAMVQLDESRVREIFRDVTTDASASVRVDRAAVPADKLPDWVQPMLEFSGEGFKLFYEWATEQTLPDHCVEWVQEFCDHRNLMLNVPPRHMKSTIFSLWLPIWLLCRNRDEQIIIVSKAQDLAVRWCSNIAEQLENNQLITETFGRFAPAKKGETVWSPGTGKLLVVGRNVLRRGTQMSILARGSGQQILGMEATVVIADDPTDAGRARSETERENELQWFREEVLSRIETQSLGGAAGRAVIIGQRVHYQDLYGAIAKQVYERGPNVGLPLWTTIVHRAISVWPDEPPDFEAKVLWPEKWNFDELMVSYERVGGHRAFSTMYQQEPLPDDARIFLPGWLESCRDHKRPGGVPPMAQTTAGVRIDSSEWVRVVSLDPSPSKFNGLIIADVRYSWKPNDFECRVLEARSWVAKMHAVTRDIDRIIDRYGPDYFILEESTVTKWASDDPWWTQLDRRIRKIPHQTGRNKHDPELGVATLAGDFEFGRIRLPYGDEAGIAYSRVLEDEAVVWNFGDHDDVLMALWFIKINRLRLTPRGAMSSARRLWNAPNRVVSGFPNRVKRTSFGR